MHHAIYISLAKSLHSSLGSLGLETVDPLAGSILIEGRISILPELRHIHYIRSLVQLCIAGSHQTIGVSVYAISVGILGRELLQHLIVGSEVLDILSLHTDLVKPSLLHIGNSTVAVCRSKAIKLAVDLLSLVYCRILDSVLEACILICCCHIPENTGGSILSILACGEQDHIDAISRKQCAAYCI